MCDITRPDVVQNCGITNYIKQVFPVCFCNNSKESVFSKMAANKTKKHSIFVAVYPIVLKIALVRPETVRNIG